jgi:hypothetical protein
MFVIDNLHKVGQLVNSFDFDFKWSISALIWNNLLSSVGYILFDKHRHSLP